MKKNLYYQTVIRRQNLFKNFIITFFTSLASYPRLLLEVFIRKNFGERYFRLSSAITVAVIVGGLPFLKKLFSSGDAETDLTNDDDATPNLFNHAVHASHPTFMSHYLTWFIFLGLFLVVSIFRYIEIRRNPSAFDFAKYSLYSGQVNPIFYKIQIPGIKTNTRLVETLLEPLPFFILGGLLWLLHQKLGVLLTVCSLFYSLGYVAAYAAGDDFVMDKIDEIICNEELKKSFVDGLDEDQTRGFRFIGRTPEDQNMRRQILPLMTGEEQEIFIAK